MNEIAREYAEVIHNGTPSSKRHQVDGGLSYQSLGHSVTGLALAHPITAFVPVTSRYPFLLDTLLFLSLFDYGLIVCFLHALTSHTPCLVHLLPGHGDICVRCGSPVL